MKGWLRNKRKNATVTGCCVVFILGMLGLNKARAVPNDNDDVPAGFGKDSINLLLPEIDSLHTTWSFINDSLCFINDATQSLSNFTRELTELLNGKDTVIQIVHLGDSHIQAGFLSGRTMRLMQNTFGNAGRGWIAPFKLSRLNEPTDYYISSNIKEWIAGRCVQLKPKCPWGIGGIGIQTEAKDINFNLIITPNNGAGYSFNKVILFRDCNAIPMTPVFTYEDSTMVAFSGNLLYENTVVDTFVTTRLIDTLHFKSLKKLPDSVKAKGSNRYYGFMLTNGNPGVLYHSIGVNGAKYKDYTNREYIRQLSLLQPSLLIVSLGTNESFGRNFNKAAFETEIDAFVRLVREEIPGATLLITTPAETYRRVYKNKKRYYVRNENISKVADVIATYAKKENIAYWDLYTITGGDNSCKNWFDAKMFGRDRIHFSHSGYDEQGILLYKALIRSCVYGQNGTEHNPIEILADSGEAVDHPHEPASELSALSGEEEAREEVRDVE